MLPWVFQGGGGGGGSGVGGCSNHQLIQYIMPII